MHLDSLTCGNSQTPSNFDVGGVFLFNEFGGNIKISVVLSPGENRMYSFSVQEKKI